MENKEYDMGAIAQFINDYKECNRWNSKEWVINIPVIGGILYQKYYLENLKRTIIENEYNKAINGSIEQQNEFISKMTPVLNDFYANKEKKKTGRR